MCTVWHLEGSIIRHNGCASDYLRPGKARTEIHLASLASSLQDIYTKVKHTVTHMTLFIDAQSNTSNSHILCIQLSLCSTLILVFDTGYMYEGTLQAVAFKYQCWCVQQHECLQGVRTIILI